MVVLYFTIFDFTSLHTHIANIQFCSNSFKDCRHANHGTDDFSDGIGLLACKFALGRSVMEMCDIQKDGKWLYEKYDGANGTWWFENIEISEE